MVYEMRKEGLVVVTVITVCRILYWGMLHAVALKVVNRLCMISRNW